ncbi:Chloronitrobenzene nitroreductase [Pseudomonas fluorescens]|uniref:nitroreductase n=1 Tax=Pseudomonas fluorescens TaxID=294 RepID=UPI00123F1758|nr:nitroreductase [Pseudomonas fluorescens]VVQ18874.1 Chloronitrobenzene nitroreductase [Pseudomonas fluorescens]
MSLLTDDFDAVVASRRAVRAFLPTPVSRELINEVIEVARLAPSNSNTQPWSVHVLTGEPKRALSALLGAAHTDPTAETLMHLPEDLPQKYRERQEQFGALFYGLHQVDKCDNEARSRISGLNYGFFGAPVGLIFTIESNLKKYSWLDYGLFLQTLMLAAQTRGLSTCPQVSFARFQSLIGGFLHLDNGHEIVCGMSLGYADETALVNSLRMPRATSQAFTYFMGFDQ